MRRTMMVWLGALGLATACDPRFTEPPPTGTRPPAPPVSGGLTETLALAGAAEAFTASCGDAFVSVYDAGEGNVLYLSVDGVASEARDAGDTLSRSYTLPHPEVTVRAVWGEHVSQLYSCNDVLYDEPVEAGRTDALTGTLVVTVTPHEDADDFQPFAYLDFELTEATFEDEDGTQTLSSWMLSELFIGWLPG